MRLQHLTVSRFRNLERLTIAPGEHFNLLYGLNGQGKTNLLESIYLLGNPRSFRSSKLSEFIQHGEPQARIIGSVLSGTGVSSIRLTLEGAGKKVLIDDKAVQRASDLHGKINVVVFSPDDTGMVKLGPETRRRYLDRAVYTSSVAYLRYWHDYHRILKQRNQLLKNQWTSDLMVWTEKLAETGAYVVFHRKQYVKQLNTRLKYYYRIISGDRESAEVEYQPSGLTAESVDDLKQELLTLFESVCAHDQKYGTTSVGPHRDDISFRLDTRSLKAFGSQGQQKSYILALKMAEMEHLKSIFGESPLLLLDDMSSELDAERSKNLVDFIIDSTIQVFITTTERSTPGNVTLPDCSVYRVNEGNLTYEGNELL